MEQKDKLLFDYCMVSNLKNIGYFWDNILFEIQKYFDKNYFNIIEIKNIDNYYINNDIDILIISEKFKTIFENKKKYYLYYDEKNNIDFWILNQNLIKDISLYKQKYFLNDYFLEVIKWFKVNEVIFWNIYLKEIQLNNFKLSFSNWLDIYLDSLRKINFYYNFGKIQILVNMEKISSKNDKLLSELLLKIIIKRIWVNLSKINL